MAPSCRTLLGNLYGHGNPRRLMSRRVFEDRPVSERTSDPLATGFGRTFCRSSPLMGQFHKLDCRPAITKSVLSVTYHILQWFYALRRDCRYPSPAL